MILVPDFILSRIKQRKNLLKIISNSGWLFFDRMVGIGISLFVGVWLARYLGPEQYGILNFAVAFVALFGILASLGFNSIIVRDLVREPEASQNILGTAFILQILGGILACGLAIYVINITHKSDDLVKVIVAVIGFTLIFKATDVIKCWFESQVNSKYIVWSEVTILLVFAAIRIYLILNEYPLVAFVWVLFFEGLVLAVGFSVLYSKMVSSLLKWKLTLIRVKELLSQSWPVMFSSGVSMINMRLDQVMLGNMTTSTVVGNYAAAIRLAEVWLIVPAIIGPSIFPTIIAVRKNNVDLYKRHILKVTKFMAMATLPVALLISLNSKYIIDIIFGVQYFDAAKYLSYYIWTGVPYLIFFVITQMYYAEDMLKVMWIISVVTLICNIILNIFLIPLYGGTGAVIATLCATYLSSILSLWFINVKTRIFI